MTISKIDDMLVQERSALIQSLSTNPEFLKNKVGLSLLGNILRKILQLSPCLIVCLWY